MINDLVSTMLYNQAAPQITVVRFARTATPDFPQYSILAARDSGIAEPQDLKGVEIGVSEGTVIAYTTDRLLQAEGLAPDDIRTIAVAQTRLPQSTLYGPPTGVRAARQGDQVLVSWEPVWMTEDDYRGYMIEAYVCQDGAYFMMALAIDGTSATITDQPGCSQASSGRLYTVEKHGYTAFVPIPWP